MEAVCTVCMHRCLLEEGQTGRCRGRENMGGSGCDLRCPFCQNHQISMARTDQVRTWDMDPERSCAQAVSQKNAGNIGVAHTYNEPLIGHAYVRDCASTPSGGRV